MVLTQLIGGCAIEERQAAGTAQTSSPFAGETEVIAGTSTPHKQKDAQEETERISGKQLEEAGATHLDHALQDVPALQQGR